MLNPRLAPGATFDIYVNPAVTAFLRHDTDGTLALVIERGRKGRHPAVTVVLPHSALETLNYWLGNGGDDGRGGAMRAGAGVFRTHPDAPNSRA